MTISKIEQEVIEQGISDDLLVSGYRLIPGRLIGSCLVICILVAIMWSQVNHVFLIVWALLMAAAIAFSDYNAKVFLRQYDNGKVDKVWRIRFLLSPLVTGTLWGTAILVFYNYGSVEQQIFIITVAISISIIGVILGNYYLPAYYVHVVPIFSSLTICFAREATFTYITLAVMMVWALIFLLSFSKMLNQTMRSELRLRHESHALADALQLKTEEAQQATMAKSRFLAAASHDLRQPLHALSLFVDVLKESKSDSEREGIFPRLELSVDALRKLFDALLDVSKLDAKVVKPEFTHFDLAELLKILAEEFKDVADKKNLKLKVHASSSIIVSDRLLLERILRNLISNAIRYTDTGGILLSTRLRGENILLQVWDTGIGIPQDSKEEIFVEFKQLHNAHRDRTQGLGLGLSLVHRLCQLLKHPLELNTQYGKGSVFSICIARGNPALLPDKNDAPIVHSWNLTGRRILVIDDEHEILYAMETLLSKWGCEVVTADSLEEAIKKLAEREFLPELVLSDLRLRDNKTGVEAIDGIRETVGKSLPGILITGDTDQEQIKRVKQNDYELMQKPVRPAHLRSAIQHHLSFVAN